MKIKKAVTFKKVKVAVFFRKLYLYYLKRKIQEQKRCPPMTVITGRECINALVVLSGL